MYNVVKNFDNTQQVYESFKFHIIINKDLQNISLNHFEDKLLQDAHKQLPPLQDPDVTSLQSLICTWNCSSMLPVAINFHCIIYGNNRASDKEMYATRMVKLNAFKAMIAFICSKKYHIIMYRDIGWNVDSLIRAIITSKNLVIIFFLRMTYCIQQGQCFLACRHSLYYLSKYAFVLYI